MAETLWFDSATWLVWLAPFAGVLAPGCPDAGIL